eukprot:UC1_evm1s1050
MGFRWHDAIQFLAVCFVFSACTSVLLLYNNRSCRPAKALVIDDELSIPTLQKVPELQVPPPRRLATQNYLHSTKHTRLQVVATWARDTQHLLRRQEVNASDKNYTDLTLCTHLTPQHLWRLARTAERFDGPVHTALLLNPGQAAVHRAFNMVKLLRACSPAFTKWVTVTAVVVTSSAAAPQNHGQNARNNANTSSISRDLPRNRNAAICTHLLSGAMTGGRNYASSRRPYPGNALRNMALKGATTSYVMVLDVDLVPMAGFHSAFKENIMALQLEASWHAQRLQTQGRVAYAIPIFEVPSSATVPDTTSSLLSAWKKGVARPFYDAICPRCHGPTDFNLWLGIQRRRRSSDGKKHGVPPLQTLSYATKYPWRAPWEPFYIAHRDAIPLYDPAYTQYGYNRVSQAYAMCLANYSYRVLTFAFAVHEGWKQHGKFHDSKESEHRANANRFYDYRVRQKRRCG